MLITSTYEDGHNHLHAMVLWLKGGDLTETLESIMIEEAYFLK